MDILTRGMIKTLKVVFTLPSTGEIFDPVDPTVQIFHYDGVNEIIDLAETTPTKIHNGHYLYHWIVPSTFPENVNAFIYYQGTDGSGHRVFIQDQFRVVPVGFYTPASTSDMVVKFTKD